MKLVSLVVAAAAWLVLSSQAVLAQSAAQRAMMQQQQMAAQQAAAQRAAAEAAQRAAMQRQQALMQQQLAAQRARMVQVQQQQMQQQRVMQQNRMDEMRRRQLTDRRPAMTSPRQASKDGSSERLLVQQLLGRQRAGVANGSARGNARSPAGVDQPVTSVRARAAGLLQQRRFENARALARERLDQDQAQRRDREVLANRREGEKKRGERRLITAVKLVGERGVPRDAANDNRSQFARVTLLPRSSSASRGGGGGGRRPGAGDQNVSYQLLARRSTRNSESKTVALGKFEDGGPNCYMEIAKKNGWTYYATKRPGEVGYRRFRDNRGRTEWDRMKRMGAHAFEFNKAFLDNQLRQGKRIVLTHDPEEELGKNTNYARELSYLSAKGYHWREDRTGRWVVYKR